MPVFFFWISFLAFAAWCVITLDLVPGVLRNIPVLVPYRQDNVVSKTGEARLRNLAFQNRDFSAPSGLRNDREGTAFPKISVIFAARDEGASIRQAVESLLKQDYPDFEVIAVNDRSSDETLSILQSFSNDKRLKILNIQELPSGWLGKTHALYEGWRISKGEYLLFTDADVFFAPGTLRAAISVFCHSREIGNLFQNGSPIKSFGDDMVDHLVLFPKLITGSLLEKAFTQAFGIALLRRFRPWAAGNPKSAAHLGIGAFNMIQREAYEKIGTHQRLALEVVDDMTLGRLVKEQGLRQRVMSGQNLISVAWVANAGGVIKSLEKNAFAGMEYKISGLIAATFGFLLLDILPFFLVLTGHGPVFYFSLGTWACLFLVSWVVSRKVSGDLRIFWTHPFACALLLYCFWRSAILVLRAGGVRWRDTFYPLSQLRR